MKDIPSKKDNVIFNPGFLTEQDIFLFKQGSHFKLYDKLGAHTAPAYGPDAVYFAVWAPNASRVSVIGDFNGWDPNKHILGPRGDNSGIWEGVIPEVAKGSLYKYHIISKTNGYTVAKGDPFASYWQTPPGTASRVWDISYEWCDQSWMEKRWKKNSLESPMSVYEVHLGSWRRVPEENNRSLTYREVAPVLADYVKKSGFTHVELLPVMEHPFYGSWGYQVTGYFAPTARYGTPQDFMFLIDYLHSKGIGVILDWVGSHFPLDEHGLIYFDGTHLYEHADPRQRIQPEWGSAVFNYSRNEVRNFLISSALFWLDKYHADGLRVDAVASMLYLNYARKDGEWVPNKFGGVENLDAIDFLKRLNPVLYENFPDIQVIAEESTAWPKVSRPIYDGGLGFGMKWNMGWMHDTLAYFSQDPLYRKHHHGELTFSMWYAFSENFILPLSHDEVVYGKGSLLGKMPGDDWQKFANLRSLFGYMYGHPGKKLIFMGGEFGQWREWSHDMSLEWGLMETERHKGLWLWLQDLNKFYKNSPALFSNDFDPSGFEWVDFDDAQQSVITFLRKDKKGKAKILVACNFTPVPRYDYKVGVPEGGYWSEELNSDAAAYGGSGCGNIAVAVAREEPFHGHFSHTLYLTLPPLSVLFLKPKAGVKTCPRPSAEV
ncbi:MAG: 1,4-alpha-glucan branching protein GlgB [Candidatus Omnitrophota bacterium]|jgi:1,4-alpha-glucan branching enzyme